MPRNMQVCAIVSLAAQYFCHRKRVPRNRESTRALWLVPIDGTEPRELEINTGNWYSLSPEGQHIAIVAAAAKAGSEFGR